VVVVEVEVLVVQWDVDEDDARYLCLSVIRENVEVLSYFVLSILDVFCFDLGISAFVSFSSTELAFSQLFSCMAYIDIYV